MTHGMERRLPVHPRLAQLEQEAADLVVAGAPAGLDSAKLSIARDYGAPDWHRLELACRLVDAIWADDLDTVQAIMREHPELLHEDTLVRKSNWGRPMSYAANLGRDRIISLLHDLGATDHEFALDRAVLQGRIATARMLHESAGRPAPNAEALGSPAYILSVPGTEFLLELGAPVVDANGRGTAPVHLVLESDSRNPEAKHAILEMYAQQMGRPDPQLLMRNFLSSEVATKANKWQGQNVIRWRNDEYDRTHRAAETELDPVKRAAHFIKLNDLLVDDFAVLPVVSRTRVSAVGQRLRAPLSGWDSDLYAIHDWHRA